MYFGVLKWLIDNLHNNGLLVEKKAYITELENMFFSIVFHREREGRGNGVWVLRCPLHGPRADDHVAERRPDGGQVPVNVTVCVLCVESCEVG